MIVVKAEKRESGAHAMGKESLVNKWFWETAWTYAES